MDTFFLFFCRSEQAGRISCSQSPTENSNTDSNRNASVSVDQDTPIHGYSEGEDRIDSGQSSTANKIEVIEVMTAIAVRPKTTASQQTNAPNADSTTVNVLPEVTVLPLEVQEHEVETTERSIVQNTELASKSTQTNKRRSRSSGRKSKKSRRRRKEKKKER